MSSTYDKWHFSYHFQIKNYIMLISVYALTLDADEDAKNLFYQQLSNIIVNIPLKNKLLLLEDFNAKVGKDNDLEENVIRKEDVRNCNSNGHLLWGLCMEHNLFIMTTQFQLPACPKTIWMFSQSKHWHLIDNTIIKQQNKGDVLITKISFNVDDC